MIVSASYKTDIPAFYSRWFMNRLRAGYCVMVNPYNRVSRRISLSRGDVDGFVFWTKNLRPFLKHLPEIRDRGFAFVIQYTITGYPRILERSVVHPKLSIEHMKRLTAEFGPRVGVWRYDTILFTTETNRDYHRRQFGELARQLEGQTDEVVVSFAQLYRKTRSNLDKAAKQHGFEWHDPADTIKRELAAELAQMAKARGMRLSMCAQRQYLARGVADASCIDARRLSDILGRTVLAAKKGNRKDCGCYAAVDIGEYDTCPHGCVYCYAVTNLGNAKRHHQAHDPESECLSAQGHALPTAKPIHRKRPTQQMRLGL